MTAQTIETTNARSAYPSAVEDLLPATQRLAVEEGRIPSRNRLKAALKIGAEGQRGAGRVAGVGVRPGQPAG